MQSAAIPEYHAIDRVRFEGEIIPAQRPAVLRGLLVDWPIVRAAIESDDALAGYLRVYANDAAGEAWFAPPDVAGRFDFIPDFAATNFERKLASVDQLLDLLLRQREAAAPWGVYAGALPIAKHLPGFLADNPMPLLDADRRMLVSLWLGSRTKTAAHWDLPQNLACVVAGRRRFTLFPIDQVANLYVGPIDRTLAGQPSSMVDIENPDLERFPRYAEALAHAEGAVLEPGDVLYMPSLWWHHVQGLDPVGAMINFWWRDAPAGSLSPLQSLLHAAMTLGALPDAERARWRALFDHYLFSDNPLAHVPEAARGVLGEQSAEQRAALKADLIRNLR